MLRLLVMALWLGAGQAAPSLTLEIRAFDGPQDVTPETRITIHRAGDRGQPVAHTTGRAPNVFVVGPGIYDAQAVHERYGRVVNIRWAERLVVMPYPDEGGHHLQVINFKEGYGALQLRRESGDAAEDLTLFLAGDRTAPAAAAAPTPGRTYTLFVVPAGTYDLRVTQTRATTWHAGIEVPRDRTRFWMLP